MDKLIYRLFIYSGGGYDGCIWEYNVCFWDKDGKFHNAYSTGHDGIKDENDALETVKVLREFERDGVKNYHHPLSSRINQYTMLLDYTKEEDCKEIAEYGASLVTGIVKFINNILQEDHNIFIKCHICEKTGQDLDDFQLDEAKHQGMASWYESFVCNECRSEFSCSYCGEDYRECREALIMNDPDESPICVNCYQEKTERVRSRMQMMVKSNIDEAICCRNEIERREKLVEQVVCDMEEAAQQEPEENLLLNDATPNLL